MKKVLIFILVAGAALAGMGQALKTDDAMLDSAFRLAVWTVDHNTHNGIIEAGAGYGGEWTRDCAMNSWNAVSLLRPRVAEKSLWSVTEDSVRIGHQYWDKIIWAIAVWNHYLVTGDTTFLKKAYRCSQTTMEELRNYCYDGESGLFMGPAVFQDGIAAYDAPVYDSTKWDDSFVLHHPHTESIKCLSTNILYYEAQKTLSKMSRALGLADADKYRVEASHLQERILKAFWEEEKGELIYLIDHLGHPHHYQEGLGVAFALMFDVLDADRSNRLMAQVKSTAHGIASVHPSFPRNTAEKPGRHNLMVWPHVNGYYASGCAHQGNAEMFYREMENMADLAVNKGKGDFYEIYTEEGVPSGGWQCGALWAPKEHQTWCATGYLRLWINHIFGITLSETGLTLEPLGMKDGSACRLSGIRYRNAELDLSVTGRGGIKSCKINGRKAKPFIPASAQGRMKIEIVLGK